MVKKQEVDSEKQKLEMNKHIRKLERDSKKKDLRLKEMNDLKEKLRINEHKLEEFKDLNNKIFSDIGCQTTFEKKQLDDAHVQTDMNLTKLANLEKRLLKAKIDASKFQKIIKNRTMIEKSSTKSPGRSNISPERSQMEESAFDNKEDFGENNEEIELEKGVTDYEGSPKKAERTERTQDDQSLTQKIETPKSSVKKQEVPITSNFAKEMPQKKKSQEKKLTREEEFIKKKRLVKKQNRAPNAYESLDQYQKRYTKEVVDRSVSTPNKMQAEPIEETKKEGNNSLDNNAKEEIKESLKSLEDQTRNSKDKRKENSQPRQTIELNLDKGMKEILENTESNVIKDGGNYSNSNLPDYHEDSTIKERDFENKSNRLIEESGSVGAMDHEITRYNHRRVMSREGSPDDIGQILRNNYPIHRREIQREGSSSQSRFYQGKGNIQIKGKSTIKNLIRVAATRK